MSINEAKQTYKSLMEADHDKLFEGDDAEFDEWCRIQNIKVYEAKYGREKTIMRIAAGKL